MLYDDNDRIRRDEYTFVHFIDAVTVFSFSLVLLLPSPQLSIIGVPAKVVLHPLIAPGPVSHALKMPEGATRPHRCASKGRSPSSSRLYKARLPQHLWRYYHPGLVTSVVRIVVGRCAHTWRTDGAARQFDCCGLFSSTAWSSKQLRTRNAQVYQSGEPQRSGKSSWRSGVASRLACWTRRSDMADMRKSRIAPEPPLSSVWMCSGV